MSVAYIGPKSRTERPRKTKIGKEVAHVTRDSDTTFKVKGQGHQAALLTQTHQAAAAVSVRTYWAWEPTATLPSVCRRGGRVGGARRFGVHRRRRGAGHIMAAARLQLVNYKLLKLTTENTSYVACHIFETENKGQAKCYIYLLRIGLVNSTQLAQVIYVTLDARNSYCSLTINWKNKPNRKILHASCGYTTNVQIHRSTVNRLWNIANKVNGPYYTFLRVLPHDAMRKRGLCCRPVSVRPSVKQRCHVEQW